VGVADAAGRNARLALVDHALEEGAGGQHDAAGAVFGPAGAHDALDHAIAHDQVFHRLRADREVGRGGQLGLHGLAVEASVDLAARAAHGGALGAVQHPELDAGRVGQAAHDAVQGVDLADQVALAQAADGRVAAHLADRLELVGEQERARAEPRRGRRRLAARVSPTDDDHVPGHEGRHIGESGGCFT
jgi:hypothetical protein